MKAIKNHTYAQILGGEVHWIFTADDLPEWCDKSDRPPHDHYIQAVDITGRQPAPAIGWTYDEAADAFAPPVVPAPTVADYENRVQRHLDETVRPRGYDGILSACSYAAGPAGDHFADEGRAALAWRSAVWSKCYAIMADVEQGKRQAPTLDGIIAELPGIVWPA